MTWPPKSCECGNTYVFECACGDQYCSNYACGKPREDVETIRMLGFTCVVCTEQGFEWKDSRNRYRTELKALRESMARLVANAETVTFESSTSRKYECSMVVASNIQDVLDGRAS